MPFPNVWIYRIGLCGVDTNGRRMIISQTWLSEQAEASTGPPVTTFRAIGQTLRRPFGAIAALSYDHYNAFSEVVYPKRRLVEAPIFFHPGASEALNPAAPEAAFRLQRVGATVSGSKGLGRICFPIRTDTYYTDLPHRRKIDVATLAPLIAANLELQPKVYVVAGRTYTNVVFSRWSMDYTPVDHFNLLENPVRIWEREKVYDWANRHVSDQTWKGPQLII